MGEGVTSIERPRETIEVANGSLLVHQWKTEEPEVVRYFETHQGGMEPQPLEVVLESALKVGVIALRSVNISVDVEAVQRRFDQLAVRLDIDLGGKIQEMKTRLDNVFDDETGALVVTLKRYMDRGGLLSDFFDPNRRDSATSRFSELLKEQLEREGTRIYRMLDPAQTDSPLFKWKQALHSDLQDIRALIELYRREIAEREAGDRARVLEREKGTAKGRDYEERVFIAVNEIASVFGDIAEPTGDQLGVGGSKIGDIVVTLNRSDARGIALRLVFEAKDRPLGLTAVQRELDEARRNRTASVAVAVYSQADHMPPGMAPLRELGRTQILCLYDKGDGGDPMALQLAYRVARLWAVAELQASDIDVDMRGINEDLETARAQLKTLASIKRQLTSVRTNVAAAADQLERDLDGLRDELNKIIERIQGRIRIAPDSA